MAIDDCILYDGTVLTKKEILQSSIITLPTSATALMINKWKWKITLHNTY